MSPNQSTQPVHTDALPTAEAVWNLLERVLDPETHLSVVAMGLIYDVRTDEHPKVGHRVWITYTLTTPMCPLAGVIQQRVRDEIAYTYPDFAVTPESVVLELVFEPVWSLDRLTPEARAELGL